MDVIDILARESENISYIYLYEESGRWYAYQQSAQFVSQIITPPVQVSRQYDSTSLQELVKVEVNMEELFNKSARFISCADREMVLDFRPSSIPIPEGKIIKIR